MGHGGGGKLGNELVEHLFLPAFRNPALENLGDAAVLELSSGRLAMSTDSFVVQPLFFPGRIDWRAGGQRHGERSCCLRRGAEVSERELHSGRRISVGAARCDCGGDGAMPLRTAGVHIVTGDTKVVERGHGDGCYINTAGVGVLRPGISVGPNRAQAGRCGAGVGNHRRSRHGHHERARGAGV